MNTRTLALACAVAVPFAGKAKDVYDAGIYSQIEIDHIDRSNRERYLEDVRAAGIGAVLLSFCEFFEEGAARRPRCERLADMLSYFESNGVPTAVWINGFGYGNELNGAGGRRLRDRRRNPVRFEIRKHVRQPLAPRAPRRPLFEEFAERQEHGSDAGGADVFKVPLAVGAVDVIDFDLRIDPGVIHVFRLSGERNGDGAGKGEGAGVHGQTTFPLKSTSAKKTAAANRSKPNAFTMRNQNARMIA
jgi:hypothetical protein